MGDALSKSDWLENTARIQPNDPDWSDRTVRMQASEFDWSDRTVRMQASEFDWSERTARIQPSEQDCWYVALGGDGIELVSLDRLGELFRLSTIDAQTMMWQPGMAHWLSLGVIAGLDECIPEPCALNSAPPVMSSEPSERAPANRWEIGLVVLAAIIGLGLSLYRNGIL